MLVLSRKLYEKIVINGDITITIVGIGTSQVRIGIDAPDSVAIFRAELLDRDDSPVMPARLASTGARNKAEIY
jgi:carbon storage regulator